MYLNQLINLINYLNRMDFVPCLTLILVISAFRQSVPGNCLWQIRHPSSAPLCLRLPTRQTWCTGYGGLHAQHCPAARQPHRSAGGSPKGTHTGCAHPHFIIGKIIDVDKYVAGTVSSPLICLLLSSLWGWDSSLHPGQSWRHSTPFYPLLLSPKSSCWPIHSRYWSLSSIASPMNKLPPEWFSS